MTVPQLALRGVVMAALFGGALLMAACSRPTPSPDQATEMPGGGEMGYPSGVPDLVFTPGPQPGDPGYPPPKTPTFDPYPGKTETAAAGGAVAEPSTEAAATEPPAVTATP